MKLTRRAASRLGLTSLAALLAAPLAAEEKAVGKRHCLSVYYPWQPDVKFDFDYYRDKHLAMVKSLYGKSVGAFQVRKGLQPKPLIGDRPQTRVWGQSPSTQEYRHALRQ